MSAFDEIRHAGGSPVEVTGEVYDYALEVLPPIYGKGCWAMGEPYSTATDGRPSFYWFAAIGGKFYGVLGSKPQAEARFGTQVQS